MLVIHIDRRRKTPATLYIKESIDWMNIWWQEYLITVHSAPEFGETSAMKKYSHMQMHNHITNHIIRIYHNQPSAVYWWKNYLAHIVGSVFLLSLGTFLITLIIPGPGEWGTGHGAHQNPWASLEMIRFSIAARLAKLIGKCECKCEPVLAIPCLAIIYIPSLHPPPIKTPHI